MMKNLLFAIVLLLITGSFVYGQTQVYYLGTGTSSDQQGTSCASCHTTGNIGQPIYDEWKNTKHAVAFDSLASISYFGYDCLPCHNTGWEAGTPNYGADEYVVKDTSHHPNYIITNTTNFNRVKNVGCEACHGAAGTSDRQIGSNHWVDYQPSLSATVCAKCHQGEHNPYYGEWLQSAHSRSTQTGFIINNKACVRCHVAQNFIMYSENPAAYRDTILATGSDIVPLSCVACHNPHSKTNTAQLRFPLLSSRTICDECHTGEIDSVDVNQAPHHSTSELLSGSPLFGFRYPGQTYINSAHTYAAQHRCVDCHVHSNPASAGVLASTGHTFEPRVEACRTCHADYYTAVDTSNHDKRFDYRGVQTTIDSLMTKLEYKLTHSTHQDSLTLAFKEANYNLLSAQGEGSHGIHNTRLVKKLLMDAIAGYNPTGVEREEGVPTAYSISQNYPNPFNPTTTIRFSVPTQGNVRIVVYDALGKEVAVLVNSSYHQGNYSVEWNAGKYSSGIYFYRIEAGSFNMVKKMILMK